MEKFRFGIIGAANIAKTFCDAVNRLENVEVVAVASRTDGKAEKFANENNIESFYSDYEEMLERQDIDAVYIATTHNFHYENAILALNYNKHILCEKAFTLTKEMAETIFGMAKNKNLFVMEAMWSRFLPAIKKAKEWIDSGILGDIELADFTIGFKSDPNPKGRMRNPELAGGAMYDIGVYAIEITDYLIPEKLKDVHSSLSYTDLGCDKVDCITLKYDNCIAALKAVMTCDLPNSLDIYGTNGRIHIDNPHYSDSCTLYDDKGIAQSYFCRRDNGFEYEIAELVSCVRNGMLESSIIPHKDTLLCAEIFDRCFLQNPR